MATNILVVYYSSYGHTYKMAQSVVEGAKSVEDTEVKLVRVAELEAAREAMSKQSDYIQAQELQKDIAVATLDDLVWADGVIWGFPTRYGNMPAQVKQFIDSTGSLWMKGALEDKPAGVFISTATTNGGQESTILTSLVPLLHLGFIFVGNPYGQNPQLLTAEGIGSSPYGAGTIAGPDGSRRPIEPELEAAKNLGIRVAKVARLLKPLRS